MTNEEYARIVRELPRGYSFLVWQGEHAHTCVFPKDHPTYTDESHCGKCWMDKATETVEAQ